MADAFLSPTIPVSGFLAKTATIPLRKIPLANGDMGNLGGWDREHFFQHGALHETKQLIKADISSVQGHAFAVCISMITTLTSGRKSEPGRSVLMSAALASFCAVEGTEAGVSDHPESVIWVEECPLKEK